MILFPLALLVLLLLSLPGIAAAADESPSTGMSYWGELPPRADSTLWVVGLRRKPAWEVALVAPYRVVTFPLTLLSRGIGGGIAWLDNSRTIARVERLLGPRRGPFGFLVEFRAGGLSGFGGGLTAEHTAFSGPGRVMRLSGSATTRGDVRATLGFRPGAEISRGLEIGAGYRLRPNARYFGVGPDTRESDESFYRQRTAWAGLSVRRPLGGSVSVEGEALYSWVRADAPPRGETPPIASVFDSRLPYGYDGGSDGVSGSLEVMHRNDDGLNRPKRGGIRRARAAYFRSIDGHDVAFSTLRAEAQQFFPLWYGDRVLALRGVASWIEGSGDDPVPFQRLLSNDDPDLLRGYRDHRFRDRGLMVVSAEYRWPIWAHTRSGGLGLDMYALADFGQVFGRARALTLNRLTESYGGGIRLESGRGMAARLEVARSREETVIRLRTDQVFQFSKRGLSHGRDPVPMR